jgi:hypothetical protein
MTIFFFFLISLLHLMIGVSIFKTRKKYGAHVYTDSSIGGYPKFLHVNNLNKHMVIVNSATYSSLNV